MSREVITDSKKGPACDIWALGCVVVEMLCGQPAFSCRPGKTLKDFLDRIGFGGESPRIPAGISKEAQDFLKRCFVRNSKSRWNAPFLKRGHFGCCSAEEELEMQQALKICLKLKLPHTRTRLTT
ncbi:hypothetical protein Sjap_003127 [Stephania japonica]|uniref:Protein kinase domain-containing protein n=1 Tax=Stephania japonica TaxID=461633 RepID=A0AAP0PTA0_9MAGN